MCDISVIARDTKLGMPATRFLGPALGSLHMFFHRLGPVQARKLLLTGDIVEASSLEHLGIFTETCDKEVVTARARYWAEKVGRMPADGVTIAKEAFRMVEQNQAYQGEEVASYLFHAYATNLQFSRASSTSSKPVPSTAPKRRSGCATNTSISTSRNCADRSHRPGPQSGHQSGHPHLRVTYCCHYSRCHSHITLRKQHMPSPVIVSAVRTAIGRSFKGLARQHPEREARHLDPQRPPCSVRAWTRRSSMMSSSPNSTTAEVTLARHAAVVAGYEHLPGRPSTGTVPAASPPSATPRRRSSQVWSGPS